VPAARLIVPDDEQAAAEAARRGYGRLIGSAAAWTSGCEQWLTHIATIANAVTSATGTAPSAGSAFRPRRGKQSEPRGNFDTFLRILTTHN
jgi:hypothetical protein